MFSSQAKASQRSERPIDSVQNVQSKYWRTFIDNDTYQLKQYCNHWNAGIRLKSSCIPPVCTVPHGGQIESLWGKKRGLEVSAEFSIDYCWVYSVSIALPRWLTFSWWGPYGLYLWHELTELAHSFLFCSRIYFCLYGHFNCISFRKFFRQLLRFLTLFFRSYLCLIGTFKYISLYESLLPPW